MSAYWTLVQLPISPPRFHIPETRNGTRTMEKLQPMAERKRRGRTCSCSFPAARTPSSFPAVHQDVIEASTWTTRPCISGANFWTIELWFNTSGQRSCEQTDLGVWSEPKSPAATLRVNRAHFMFARNSTSARSKASTRINPRRGYSISIIT
jgi:hypothetical protein